ncbi:MYG1 family protein [Persicobacter psychrovividus]|uniref:MYG1 family protein n=1 Tax=Persicobacter psychrovividus TaxID=387638 RepID=UPI0030CA34F8
MKTITLITHDGHFHADEIFATAIGLLYAEAFQYQTKIVRTRDADRISAVKNKSNAVWTIDVGGTFDPDTNDFDHHQDKDLACSCVMLWQYKGGSLLKAKAYGAEKCHAIYNGVFKKLSGIDYFDRGIADAHDKWYKSEFSQNGVMHLNQLIREMNHHSTDSEKEQNSRFEVLVLLAKEMLKNWMETAALRWDMANDPQAFVLQEGDAWMSLKQPMPNWRSLFPKKEMICFRTGNQFCVQYRPAVRQKLQQLKVNAQHIPDRGLLYCTSEAELKQVINCFQGKKETA